MPPPVPPEQAGKKTRKPRAPKTPDGIPTEQVEALLLTTFAVLATRPGFEPMALTKEEAAQISKPLCNIINKSDAFKAIAEHSDAIALGLACTTIFVPKMFITYEMSKAKKKGGNKDGRKNDTGAKATSVGSAGNDDGPRPGNNPGSSNGLLADLPSIVY